MIDNQHDAAWPQEIAMFYIAETVRSENYEDGVAGWELGADGSIRFFGSSSSHFLNAVTGFD